MQDEILAQKDTRTLDTCKNRKIDHREITLKAGLMCEDTQTGFDVVIIEKDAPHLSLSHSLSLAPSLSPLSLSLSLSLLYIQNLSTTLIPCRQIRLRRLIACVISIMMIIYIYIYIGYWWLRWWDICGLYVSMVNMIMLSYWCIKIFKCKIFYAKQKMDHQQFLRLDKK